MSLNSLQVTFLPRKSDRETELPSLSKRVKSGAFAPISSMVISPLQTILTFSVSIPNHYQYPIMRIPLRGNTILFVEYSISKKLHTISKSFLFRYTFLTAIHKYSVSNIEHASKKSFKNWWNNRWC